MPKKTIESTQKEISAETPVTASKIEKIQDLTDKTPEQIVNEAKNAVSKIKAKSTLTKEDVIARVSKDPFSLKNFKDSFRKDFDVVCAAAAADPRSLEYALSEGFSIEQQRLIAEKFVINSAYPEAFQFMHHTIRRDEQIVEKLVFRDVKYFAYADSFLKSKEDFVSAIMQRYPKILEFSPLNANASFVLKQIQDHTISIVAMCKPLHSDKGFLLDAMHVDYKVLQYATDDLKNNADFMLKAIEQNPKAIIYASASLCNNKAFMREAVKKDSRLYMRASKRVKRSTRFAAQAIAVSGDVRIVSQLQGQALNNVDVAVQAIMRDYNSYTYFDKKVLEHPKVQLVLEFYKMVEASLSGREIDTRGFEAYLRQSENFLNAKQEVAELYAQFKQIKVDTARARGGKYDEKTMEDATNNALTVMQKKEIGIRRERLLGIAPPEIKMDAMKKQAENVVRHKS